MVLLLRRLRRGHKHGGDAGELQHGEDGVGHSHDSERPAHGLELFEIFQQHADARRADVIHLCEVEVNVMLPGADGQLDGAANMVGPVGVHPALELQFEPPITRVLSDFHDCVLFH